MKYKLIKEYPGSPKLGTIIAQNSKYYYQILNGNANIFSCKNIENHPEFWQPVIEKDYEILEYKTENGISCKAPFLPDSHQFYINERCKIHSVKRLSDGEIFTVGDDIKSSTCSVSNKILSIEIINNQIRIYPRNSFYNLKDIQKIKQPLFTTEDGVDVFEGDSPWFAYIDKNGNGLNNPSQFHKITSNATNMYKYFSTKEAAEEYILMNKVCLSIKEIVDIADKGSADWYIVHKLRNLITLKIKQSV